MLTAEVTSFYSGFASILVEEGRTVSSNSSNGCPRHTCCRNGPMEVCTSRVRQRQTHFRHRFPAQYCERVRGPRKPLFIDELPSRTHDRERTAKIPTTSIIAYEGPQRPCITPGEVTQVSWSCLGIVDHRNHRCPSPSPAQVHASVDDDGILVRWALVEPPKVI